MISFTSEGVDCQVTIEVKDLDELITTNDLRQLDIFVTDRIAEKFLLTIFERCIDLISIENESKYEHVH
jgi:hypothetical protein|tara:strand:+ start:293 stop:499 length:207 start_codon:yes stop_codon:yes gene_type:complete